jgi:outer membrane protein insertion porin family
LKRAVVAVVLFVCALPAMAEDYLISAIEFRDNATTKASTMLQELSFSAGDVVSDRDIERGRQAIMNLGLFKRVSADLERRGGQTVLIYSVNEKHYLLPLPRLSRSGDGDWAWGARLRWDNIAGRNRRLDIGFRRKDLTNSDIEREDRVQVEYLMPRIWGSPWELGFDVRSEQIEIDEDRDDLSGRYNQHLDSLRVNLSRWMRETGPSQGWRLHGQVRFEDYDNEYVSGDTGLYFDTKVTSLVFGAEYRKVKDLLYSRTGRHFGYAIETASAAWGSESSFVRHSLFYRRYKPVTRRAHTNLNYQVRYGTSSGSTFGDPSYSIGGNSTMRGYERESLEGESYFITNVEFLRPMFGHKTFRGALFADIGGAFDDSASFNFSELEVGLGVGIRYKLRSFVNTDLRLDFAYGLDGSETKVYGSTETTF